MDLTEIASLVSSKPEPLHPDLAETIRETGLGSGIYHPLVHDPFYTPALNALINKRYLYKRQALAEAVVERNWNSYIYLHERPYRAEALRTILEQYQLPSETYWALVRDVWMDSENIFQHADFWRRTWSAAVTGRITHVMDENDQQALMALPETFPVYRGSRFRKALKGLSWTTDRDRAVWFGRRFSKAPYLATGTIRKPQVLAYLLGRNESEIVTLPESVTGVTVSKL